MAATKYLEIYNADNILIIDDTFQNLTLRGSVYANGYIKCTQKSDFDAKKTQIYQYCQYTSDREWEAMISFDVDSSKDELLAFTTSAKDEKIKIFPLRLENRYVIYVVVPFDSEYGKDEAAFKKYLSHFVYNIYGKYDIIDKDTGSGLMVYNADGKPVFDSDLKYMRVKEYFYKCTENLVDAEQVFEQTILDIGIDGEVAPFSACQFWRYSPQMLYNYRFYLSFLKNNQIKCGIALYGLTPNQGVGITGALQIVTSLMILQGYYYY